MTKEIVWFDSVDAQIEARDALLEALNALEKAAKMIPQNRLSLTHLLHPKLRETNEYVSQAHMAIRNAILSVQEA